MKIHPFNFTIFIITTLIFLLFSLMSFTATFTIDEGSGDADFWAVTLARLFPIFRFPTHTFFANYFGKSFFFFGLGINSMFYSLLIERIIGLLRSKKNED